MSDFFDDLEHAIRRAASNVSTEVSVAAQEQKVKDAYQTLGRMYYQAIRQGNEPRGDGFDAEVSKIRALLANIHELRRNQKVSNSDFENMT